MINLNNNSINQSISTNNIYNMDCLEGMKYIEDKSIDMVLTDPPYGINLTPQRKNGKFKNTKVKNDDNLDWLPDLVSEYSRILKPDAVGYIFCN